MGFIKTVVFDSHGIDSCSLNWIPTFAKLVNIHPRVECLKALSHSDTWGMLPHANTDGVRCYGKVGFNITCYRNAGIQYYVSVNKFDSGTFIIFNINSETLNTFPSNMYKYEISLKQRILLQKHAGITGSLAMWGMSFRVAMSAVTSRKLSWEGWKGEATTNEKEK